jgi:hypothetical protein
MLASREVAVSREGRSRANVDRVIAEISAIVREATVDLSLRVGQLVVERFFDGEATNWRARNQYSLRKLAQHPDLPMSASALRRCIGLYELAQRFGDLSRYERLGTSHFRAIIGLEEAVQRQLLEEANREHWTVNTLERHASEVRDRHQGKGGRPRLPTVVKLMRRLTPLAAEANAQLEGLQGLDELNDIELDEVRAHAARTMLALRDLERRLARETGTGIDDA